MYLVGNWKMNMAAAEAASFAQELAALCSNLKFCRVMITPPFTSLAAVAALKPATFELGAQNVHWAESGAFTGEVSAQMLMELNCSFALCGHSERRHLFGETLEICAKRAEGALASGLRVIFCVGETLQQRDAGQTNQILEEQLKPLKSLSSDLFSRLMIAYEPVWAIGTGKVAEVDDIASAHGHIKSCCQGAFGELALLYGGSVSPDNFQEISACPLVDGALVGGASLSIAKFSKLIEIAEEKAHS